jgi:hypothetical protein
MEPKTGQQVYNEILVRCLKHYDHKVFNHNNHDYMIIPESTLHMSNGDIVGYVFRLDQNEYIIDHEKLIIHKDGVIDNGVVKNYMVKYWREIEAKHGKKKRK